MIRAVVLSLLVVFSIAVIIPVMDSSAHGERAHGHHRHHSKAWWRRYHARKRHRAHMARLKASESGESNSVADNDANSKGAASRASTGGSTVADPRGFWNATLPAGWSSRTEGSNGEVKFRIYTQDGRPAGYSALAQMNLPPSAKPALASKSHNYIGGMSFTDLKRSVIDKMMANNGWVTNDYERDLDGKRIFVVVAQTAASQVGGGGPQPWSFFFTEVDGRVYSLVTTAPPEFYEQANQSSEQLLGSFRTVNRPSTVASISR